MEENNIRKYAKLMQEYDLTGLEITENESVLRLERTGMSAAPVNTVSRVVVDTGAETTENKEREVSGYTDIRSPMVGVFYCAPAEDAKPFVSVGDTVKKGDTLCIIEAMKLMNEISAEQDGVIAEVCVGNGQVVDYGHVLFRMKREQ